MRSVEFACIFRGNVATGNLPVKPPQRSDLNQLASLILGAIQSEEGLAQRFSQMGIYLQTSTASAFREWIQQEIPKWADVVRRSNIKME